jgi:hypothetical protein
MVSNDDRAEWAQVALQAFADECMFGRVSEESVTDLICDLGHFAERELSLPKTDIIRIFATAIGAWIAESRHPDGEPWANDVVKITYKKGQD